jgi:manganese transport protein
VVSLMLLVVQDRRGQRVFERVITGLLMVIAIGFLSSLFVNAPPADQVVEGLLPRFHGAESVLLATAMLGATVMPHAVYLHSGLARDRHGHPPAGAARRLLLRATRWDVGIAMLIAGAVNMSMLLVAATNLQGRADTDSIEGAHAAVRETLGPTVALFFAIGLLASGLASTSVGAYAGAMIMQGLLRKSFPLLVRRLVTLIPALVVLGIGVDPSRALVISQVVLSFGIPFALVPLIRLTSDPDLMGADTNRRITSVLGWGVAAIITLLNVVLIYLTLTG